VIEFTGNSSESLLAYWAVFVYGVAIHEGYVI